MCLKRCTKLSDACEECIEEACQAHSLQREHEAVLAFVPASADEWRKRLDEVAPLVNSLTSLQGTSDAQD